MVTYLHKRPRVERRAADFCCGRGRSRARLHSQGGPMRGVPPRELSSVPRRSAIITFIGTLHWLLRNQGR